MTRGSKDARFSIDSQLMNGVLEICVMAILLPARRHGYDVMKRVRNFFPDVGTTKIYRILRQANADGRLDSFFAGEIGDYEKSGGSERKYYEVTQFGEKWLKHAVKEWDGICTVMEKLGISR